VFRIRLVASAVLLFGLAAFVGGQDPKKDPPKDPPKAAPKDPPKDAPKDAPKDTPKDAPKDAPKTDGKRFEFVFTKDKKFYSETNTKVTQTIQLQGQGFNQKQESTFWYEWTPLEQTPDGKWKIRQKVEGLKMNIDISGNRIDYDSTKDTQTAGNPGLNEFFKKLGTAEFTATLSKDFRVEKVDGKEAFISNITSGSAQMNNLLQKIFTDDALKDLCDPTLKMIPETPKKPGESWERKYPLNLGPIGTYEATYKFTYIGPGTEADKKDMDKIDVIATVEYQAPKDDSTASGLLFRIKGGNLKSDPMAPAKGVIWYNNKAQRPESAEINLKLKGSLTVAVGGSDATVELEMEQKSLVKYSDTSLKPAVTAKAP
jgi:hypothetical protein